MAARLRKTNEKWKYYVYQFFSGETCVYVGKGCANRFKVQSRRFKYFKGYITAYFIDEKSALEHERILIQLLAPTDNISLNPVIPRPWEYRLTPEFNKDFEAWCTLLGTKQMVARILLEKPWSILKKYGIKINQLLSLIDSYKGVYHGSRC